MNVQQVQNKSSIASNNSNSMYSSTPANLSNFPHQNSVPMPNNNPANSQTTNNLRQYQGNMPAKVSPHMYQQTFPPVASTIVNANTYKPPTMPPTNGNQLSNGVPSNKDWNTNSTTQPRNGVSEFAAQPFSNAVGGSVGSGNGSNQQQLSHQSVTGVHQVGGLQNRLMSSGPSTGNQSMYHPSNTFQHLSWGTADNQRSTFGITSQNPPPTVLRSSTTSSVIAGPVVSTQDHQLSWLPTMASNASYHQQPRANLLNASSNMQQFQSRPAANSMGSSDMMMGMLKGNTQQCNNHDFNQAAPSIQQQASPWNNNQYVQPEMVATQQHDNTWAHQTSHQPIYNRQVAPRSVAIHETSVIGQQASSFHGDNNQTTVQQHPGAQAAWNAAGFMQQQQQQQDFIRQGQQHTMRSDNNWQNTNIDVNNLWQPPVHPDRNQNANMQDFQMSSKFKYQNSAGSQLMIGKSRSEVKGKQLWDPNNKSQPPPVVHSDQQLVDKRKVKGPDVMKLMEEFGKTAINQNEVPKKIVPRPNPSRNLIMSLSEKFQRSEEIAKLKSFMERNNLSTKLATNNVNGAKWVVELKFNEKFETIVGVGEAVDQKDAVEKAVCCLLNQLEKSGLMENKNKPKGDITILKNTAMNNAKTNAMKNTFNNPDNRRYKNIRPNTSNVKNNAVTNNVVPNSNKQQNNVPIPPPFIFNNGHQGNHPRPSPHHEPMPWYPYPPPMGPNFRLPMGQNFRPHFDHGVHHPMGPPMMFNGPRPMIPQPYHPMMMPHHIHGNHPMMYPQPPHHHPMNFMDPDVDDEEMFPSADSFIDRMIMNQREATMQAGEMFDGPNMRLGDDWNNSKQSKMSLDDRHIYDKHNQIYPSKSELDAFEKIVGVTEKVLKKLSDKFVNEDYPITSPEAKQELGSGDGSSKVTAIANKVQVEKGAGDEASPKKQEQKPKVQILKRPKKSSSSTTNVLDDRPRILNGVSRVGHLSKGLIIKGDNVVEIVAYCGEVPTSKLLDRVMEHIPEELSKASEDLICKVERTEAGFNVIAESLFKITLAVTMTWVEMDSRREKQNDDVEEEKKDEDCSLDENKVESSPAVEKKDISMVDLPENVLSEKLQLAALAKVRQAKWFQQHASRMDTCMTVIRIFREMQNRVEAWKSLPCWTLEVIVYKALTSSNEQMSTADAFRRVLEVIAGGLLLPDGPGIRDPCEKGDQDILASCVPQVLEDITAFAQTSLSLIAFRAIHQVLDVPRIAAVKPIIFSNNMRQGLVGKITIKQKEVEKSEEVSEGSSAENSVKDDKPNNETKEMSPEEVLIKE